MSYDKIKNQDAEVYASMMKELDRQRDHIELIASENFVSEAVMEAMGSHLTNKYAEGYPGARYYGGCQYVDEVEELARERAKKIFERSMQMYSRIPALRQTLRFISRCSSRAILSSAWT